MSIMSYIRVGADIPAELQAMSDSDRDAYLSNLSQAQGVTTANYSKATEFQQAGPFIVYGFITTSQANLDLLIALLDSLYGPPNATVMNAVYSDGMYSLNLDRTLDPETGEWVYTQKEVDGVPMPDPYPCNKGLWNGLLQAGKADYSPALTANGLPDLSPTGPFFQ